MKKVYFCFFSWKTPVNNHTICGVQTQNHNHKRANIYTTIYDIVETFIICDSAEEVYKKFLLIVFLTIAAV